MTELQKKMKKELDQVRVDRNALNAALKDRLDFGFDSIYFRYSEICDELATYRAYVKGTDPIKERQYMSNQKMHFYMALEQLLRAHDDQEKKNK